MSALSELGSEAVRYASMGWKVFPIAAGTKDRPMVKWGAEASSDPGAVAAWWRRWPDANIGLACGASGLAAVDLDDKKGKRGSARWAELEVEHGAAPPTLVSRTPSGGRHRIYRGEARTVQDLGGAEGVDVRGSGGSGGYVLLAPSRYSPTAEQAASGEVGGEYRWEEVRPAAPLPRWVRELAGRRAEARQHDDGAASELDTPFALEFARLLLSRDWPAAVSGRRGQERTFRAACALREKGVSRARALDMALELYNPRCEPPWEHDALRKIFDNAWQYASVSRAGGDHPTADFAGEPPLPPDMTPPGVAESARGVDWADWAWIARQLLFVRRSDRKLWSAKAFDTKFARHVEKGSASSAGFRGRLPIAMYDEMVFRPGEPERAGACFNTWRPSGLEPNDGDASTFLRHVENLLPDPAEAGLLLDWTAWVLQNPSLKPMFMPVIQGVQGTGKSWYGELLRLLVGTDNVKKLNTGNVASRFNSWAVGLRLAIIEELMSDDKRALANALKPLITEDVMMVELKGRDVFEAENHMALIAFTNYRDAVRLENSDRRYLILSSPARPLGQAAARELWGFLRGDGPGAVLREMLARPVDREWGLGRAPRTAAHEDMRREAMPEVERHLREELDLGNRPFDADVVTVEDLIEALPGRLARERGMHRSVAAFLKDEADARNLGQHRVGGRGARKVRLWSLRRHEEIAAMTPKQRVDLYLRDATDFPDERDPLL
jgi:bifunctional DNA primase/polymerase-like protein/uncharacterized protein DUF5906